MATHRVAMHAHRAAADLLELVPVATVGAASHRAAVVPVIPRTMAMRRVVVVRL